MNLDFARRLRIGFSQAVNVTQLAPCLAYGEAGDIDARYADYPKSNDFPNPWHIGTVNTETYPEPRDLKQSELELLVYMFGMVIELKPKLVVETGCNIGLMTRALAAACWVNGFGMVISCDIDKRMVAYAKTLCVGLPASIEACASTDLVDLYHADLVYLDCDHQPRAELLDRVKSGTVYVSHDTYANRSIRDLRADWFNIHIDGPRGFSVGRKP